jgi:hypothetical protein
VTPGGGLAQAPEESTTVTVEGGDLTDVRQQLTTLLVQVATLGQTLAGVREDIARQDVGRLDHEGRIRTLESRREVDHAAELAALAKTVADQGTEIEALKRIRWMATGAAFALGTSGGALLSNLLS